MREQRKLIVVGQGYVGHPLAMRAVEAGFSVVGVDTTLAAHAEQRGLPEDTTVRTYLVDASSTEGAPRRFPPPTPR
ncbi:hypothetical protein GCM10010271_37760 [Streptomyces kurssanovii]|nr:hypothetical protein GCM10010271_37760 [Streptomyces kurssanovii]